MYLVQNTVPHPYFLFSVTYSCFSHVENNSGQLPLPAPLPPSTFYLLPLDIINNNKIIIIPALPLEHAAKEKDNKQQV
jgi:hypothetical protein